MARVTVSKRNPSESSVDFGSSDLTVFYEASPDSNVPPSFAPSDFEPPTFSDQSDFQPPTFSDQSDSEPPTFSDQSDSQPPTFSDQSDSEPPIFFDPSTFDPSIRLPSVTFNRTGTFTYGPTRGEVASVPRTTSPQPRLSADSGVCPEFEDTEFVPGFKTGVGQESEYPGLISAANTRFEDPIPAVRLDHGASDCIVVLEKTSLPKSPAHAPRTDDSKSDHLAISIDPADPPNSAVAPSSAEDATSVSSSDGGPCCRICLVSEEPEDLLKPCSCSGTSAYCHASCLQKWLQMRKKEEGDPPSEAKNDFLVCGVCKDFFDVKISYELRPDRRVFDQICKQKKDILKFFFWLFCLINVVLVPLPVVRMFLHFFGSPNFILNVMVFFLHIFYQSAGIILYMSIAMVGFRDWVLPAAERWRNSNRLLVISAPDEEAKRDGKNDGENDDEVGDKDDDKMDGKGDGNDDDVERGGKPGETAGFVEIVL